MFEKILLKNADDSNYRGDINSYIKRGGYKALEKAFKEYKPEEIIEIIKKSGLRGRGGAGFPTGVKWGFIPKDPNITKYLCCNADEGEPGTFKDRQLMERDPHQLIEGIIISSYAVGINTAYIYIRGEFYHPAKILERAIKEAEKKGFTGKNILGSNFSLDIFIHRGAGAYICGEETGLIESLEGKRGHPRLKPPFPANIGLFGKPTVINNVETLCNIPHIINRGAEWFSSIGTPKSTGTRIFSISGHVNKPGNYELPLGMPLREIIYDYAGGIRGDKNLKAVIPGGSSSPVFTQEHLEVKMDFDSVAEAGSMLGSGGIIVLDESTCMLKISKIVSHFYSHESCGQCSQCREGTAWLYKIISRIYDGKGKEDDIEIILDICENMKGKTICPLSDAAAMPIESYIKYFRDEFIFHIKEGHCELS